MNKPIRILHLEDSESDAELVELELKKENILFEFLWVNDKKGYEKALKVFLPDVILCDHSLVSITATEALQRINSLLEKIPLIVVSANESEELVIQMAKEGVDDYIFKNKVRLLPKAILSAIEKTSNQNSKIQYHKIILSQEKRFKALIENISEAIILVKEDGKIIYQSPSATNVTGYIYEEIKDKTIFTFFHPEDVPGVSKFFKLVFLKPGIPLHKSFRIIHKNGRSIWVEGTITNLLEDENVQGFIINCRDITERKKYENRLLKSEANLRTIFDNTHISYILLDKRFNIVSFNQEAYAEYLRESGWDITEGRNYMDYLPEEKKNYFKKEYILLLTGQKVNYETSYEHSNGNITWYKKNILPVWGDDGKLLGLIITTEDITNTKNTDLEKEKMTSDLLRHNKNLEQFAYIISHNLRSPVANILGLSNMIQSMPEMNKEDFKRCMEGLVLSVKKMDDIIIDLNTILQVKNSINEKKEVVKFSALVKDIKLSIHNLIKTENIDIKTNFIKENNFFTVKSYLYSIFFNLILNSIKYRQPNKPASIEITTSKNNGKLLLSFKDNGLGIDIKAHAGKIFGLYKKFHPHIEGKGMGLYMVKTQVEILGGTINVISKVNEGTEFLMEFNL